MKISVLGCGWLGLPAGRFLADRGHHLKGSTTSRQNLDVLKEHAISPYLMRITSQRVEGDAWEAFWEADLLFVNIPPGRSRGDVLARHPKEVEVIIDKVIDSGIPWVIFASSTSVYGNYGGLKTEEHASFHQASSDSGKALICCEEMLRSSREFDTTIIRFGGLYGYERHPGRNLAGRKNLERGNKPVNLIHRDDCVRIIGEIIGQNARHVTLNAVCDDHPTRQEFYRTAADQFGLEKPSFKTDTADPGDYKIVSNKKLKQTLNYQFLYPSPRNRAP